MKTIKNPVEVNVRLTQVGHDVVRVVVESSLRLVPIDHRQFVYDVVTALVGRCLPLHHLFDGSALLCGGKDTPFPSCSIVLTENHSLSIEPRVYELPDGSVRNVSFTLEHRSSDLHRDYMISDVRFIRLLGVVTIELDDCNEEES